MSIKIVGFCKDTKKLPASKLPDGAVPFKEPDDLTELNLSALLFTIPALFVIFGGVLLKRWVCQEYVPFITYGVTGMAGVALLFIFMLPHELLHAMAFPKDSEIQIYFTRSGALCYSPAAITKNRFIVMSLLPAIVLGLLPLLIWLFLPAADMLSDLIYTFGALNLISCTGDFVNVYNALCQMPSGSYQQLSGFHSYWFLKS